MWVAAIPARSRERAHLLLLREDRPLLELLLPDRLLPLALARPLLLLLRELLLRPLEAVPRLLLREDDPGLEEEEEELRDAIACSLLDDAAVACDFAAATLPQSRQDGRGACRQASVLARRNRPARGDAYQRSRSTIKCRTVGSARKTVVGAGAAAM
jgi:hypothetical protein